ncbi:MAG: ribosome hibernation-promoting factor, HPF/YfiA family [Candidatus Nealsonbacteria bacterium]
MKISIKSTNIKLSPAIREFIESKISPLEKFIKIFNDKGYRSPSGKLKTSLEAFIEIEKGTHHKKGPFFRAECQLMLPGRIIRSEASSANLRIAVNEVKDELQRELKRQKGRFIARAKRKSRTSKTNLKISPSARFHKKERNLEEGT